MQTHSASKYFFYISFKICCWYPEGQKGSLSHASLSKRNPVQGNKGYGIFLQRALMVVMMGTLILALHCSTWQNRHATANQRGPRPLAGLVRSPAHRKVWCDGLWFGLVPLRQFIIKLQIHFSLVYTGRGRVASRQHNPTTSKMQREIFSLMHPMRARNKENFHCYLLIFILEFTIGSLLLEKFYNN